MKKSFYFLIGILAMFIMPLTAFSQVETAPVNVLDLQGYFVSLLKFSAIIIPVTSLINQVFGNKIAWLKQFASWIVSFVLGACAWGLQWGIFENITWYVALIYSLSAALVANGIFDIEVVKIILRVLRLEPTKEIPNPES